EIEDSLFTESDICKPLLPLARTSEKREPNNFVANLAFNTGRKEEDDEDDDVIGSSWIMKSK
ncbi:MAG: hypothetical protein M3R00_03360, partial [Pseudomonadota bacterium]|nr:hypothetical protein [Pseudomonadota bacterium]